MLGMLALVLCLQETETIPKNHRAEYNYAVSEYERAWLNLESDPKTALQMVEHIFAIKMFDKKDRKLVFEKPNGMLAKPMDFYPNNLRGRIRLVLAKNEPDNALALLAAAQVDFKASADAGVKPSEDLLKSTKAALEKLRAPKPAEPPKESPVEQAFREPWFKLIEAHKYKAARDYIDAKGGPVSVEKRRQYVRDTEDRCRNFVSGALENFVKAIEVNARPGQLRATKPVEFNRLYELPSEADLIGSYPDLEWARKERPVLEKLRLSAPRAREDECPGIVDLLIAQMLLSEPLEKTGENRWFKASAQLAFRYVEEVILSLGTQSKDAFPEQCHRLHETAEKVRAKWSEALAKVPKEFLVRNQVLDNAKRLSTLLDEFPVDADELEKLDLDACFVAVSPDAALEHVISDLIKIRDQQGARLPKVSIRKLLTELVAATAARELLAGKGAEEVTRALHELGRSLSQAGGPVDAARYGPKIEKIFTALK
jgi:hypothetical protein